MGSVVRLEQPSKAELPISSTELGTLTDFRLEQPSKVWSLIIFNELGSVTEVRPLQFRKA